MYIILFFYFFSLISANLTLTAYFSTPQTFNCTPGLSCFSHNLICSNSTSNCYFDLQIQIPSGQTVNGTFLTTFGITKQYLNWENYAIQGQLNVSGPYNNTFSTFTCTDKPYSNFYLRIYCSSFQCNYSLTLFQTWAIGDCGIIWKDQVITTCDNSCQQQTSGYCYYSTSLQRAPNDNICVAGLGAYVPNLTACPINTTCGINSVCVGPAPTTCVNLCENVSCGLHGICVVDNNAQTSCWCDLCYSGSRCDIPPTGSWVNYSWTDCDCKKKVQTRVVQCETSFGCVLPKSYCIGPTIESQNCSASCPITLDSVINDIKNSWFYIAVAGGPGLFLICCLLCCLKYKRRNKPKKFDEKYLHLEIPVNSHDPLASSYNNASPSHSKYNQSSPLSFPTRPSSASFSRPPTYSMVSRPRTYSEIDLDQSRPAAPSFALPRPLTPSPLTSDVDSLDQSRSAAPSFVHPRPPEHESLDQSRPAALSFLPRPLTPRPPPELDLSVGGSKDSAIELASIPTIPESPRLEPPQYLSKRSPSPLPLEPVQLPKTPKTPRIREEKPTDDSNTSTIIETREEEPHFGSSGYTGGYGGGDKSFGGGYYGGEYTGGDY